MEAVRQAVLSELMNSVSKDVELESLRVIKSADIVNGDDYIVNHVTLNGYSGRNKIVFLVSLTDKEKRIKTMVAEASYDVLMDVLITSRPLANGAVITENDFYEAKQKSSRLPVGALSNRRDIEGKVLKANIGQGVILRSDLLATHASIKRGQKVTVLIEGSNVVLTTTGLLRNDAAVGGTARVLCDVSKKEVYGILMSPDTVKVKI